MTEVYCGPAVAPDMLRSAWNLDFTAIALSLSLAFTFHRTGHSSRNLPFWSGLFLFVILFMSPFCALTVALFSARTAHHVVLISIVAPLLALSFPAGERTRRHVPLALLVTLHAGILWLWHAPAVYDVAIRSALPYWLMQLSLLGSAFVMWRRILAPQVDTGLAILALLATVVQMGMLGALLTFARAPLYAAHLTTTFAFGLSPRADQQLAGLIMWVPAALPYMLAAALMLFARFERSTQVGR
ncbi:MULTISPECIES: cytochrome c oxidase assembly protein [unclassified Chelatococcus]|uniref:cytochrome c oxidase assembly protein n=1 Tax=unclassified Chelatococcus TaxID=2638111 RepID=UPI001BD04280|nr:MULTISPECIES: cytochrome c oxidase assembly protein [unclassified Chelatococcus]MBS7700510.1 cytochrome c oxidase assembly protein [Chelatococcus sp. YT9]MBX3556306.1 cytochrome c oxidase assembly protein [Chelatococcus sp.]